MSDFGNLPDHAHFKTLTVDNLVSESTTVIGSINLNGNKIINSTDATNPTDVPTFQQIPTELSEFTDINTTGAVLNDRLEYSGDNVWVPVPSTGTESSTGLLTGGLLSIGTPTSTFTISDGTGIVFTDDPLGAGTVTKTNVSWTGHENVSIDALATVLQTYILIDNAGEIVQQTIKPTNENRRDNIFLGTVSHVDNTTVTNIRIEADYSFGPLSQLRDLTDALGYLNVSGNVISPKGSNLQILKSIGMMYATGVNYENNPQQPNLLIIPSSDSSVDSFAYLTQDSTVFTGQTVIDPENYDVAGTKTNVTATKFTTQRIYSCVNLELCVLYGQTLYDSLGDAQTALFTESFIVEPGTEENGMLVAYVIIQQGVTDLTAGIIAETVKIIYSGKFGATGIGGAAGDLQTSYDNSVTTDPEILTNATNVALGIRQGSGADTDNVLEIQNGAGAITAKFDGNGKLQTAFIDSQDGIGDGTTGTTLSITAGDGQTTGDGGIMDISAGVGGLNGDGGVLNLVGGAGGTNAGTGGTVNLTGGAAAFLIGDGGDVNLTGGISSTIGDGGNVNIQGGYSSTINGGVIALTGGTVGTAGIGGDLIFTAGSGGSIGTGGTANLIAGDGGTPGDVSIDAGDALSSGIDGGDIDITAGVGNTSGIGGNVFVQGGSSTGSAGGSMNIKSGPGALAGQSGGVQVTSGVPGINGNSGSVFFISGPGGSASGDSGNVAIGSGSTSVGVTGSVTIISGDPVGGNSGPVTVKSGTTTSTYSSGLVTIGGGTGSSTGTGASTSILAGDGGIPGDISIDAGDALSSGIEGGDIDITAGVGNMSGTGGDVKIDGGIGGSTGGLGGFISLTSGAGVLSSNSGGVYVSSGVAGPEGGSGPMYFGSGNGGSTSGDSGIITVTSGNTTSGVSGSVLVDSGDSVGGNSGPITVKSGTSNSTYSSGLVTIGGGAGSSTGTGASTSILAGNGGTPGVVSIDGGNASAIETDGGNINIISGDGNTTGAGGLLTLSGGASGLTGTGGGVTIIGGDSTSASTGIGGNITVKPGIGGPTGLTGSLLLGNDPITEVAVDSITPNWSFKGPTITDEITDIVWAGYPINKFIAVGDDVGYHSSDGETWTAATTVPNYYFRKVIYSKELSLLVAVGSSGSSGYLATSTDGDVWTVGNVQGDEVGTTNWNAISWSPTLGIFSLLGGAYTTISSDGFNWTTPIAMADSMSNLKQMNWSPKLGLFVAVGNYYTASSPDGINWTKSEDGVTDVYWESIVWSNELELFCAVTTYRDFGFRSMVSIDGITWSSVGGTDFGADSGPSFTNVEWSPQLSMFVTIGGTDTIYYSFDGLIWTDAGSLPVNNIWSSIAWSCDINLFAACDSSTVSIQKFAISVPDISAFNQTTIIGTQHTTNLELLGRDIEIGNGSSNIIIGKNGCNTIINTNLTLDSGIISGYNGSGTDVPGGSIYVMGGKGTLTNANSGSVTLEAFQGTGTGDDGIIHLKQGGVDYNWPSADGNAKQVLTTDGSGILNFASVSAVGNISKLDVGNIFLNSFESRATAGSESINDIIWADVINKYVAVGNGVAWYSNDGETWTLAAGVNAAKNWRKVSWSPTLGIFVALSLSAVTMTSSDGETWSAGSISAKSWWAITWAPGLDIFVAVAFQGGGESGDIAHSSDGTTWTYYDSPLFNYQYVDIVYSPELNLFVCVSLDRKVIISSDGGETWSLQSAPTTAWYSVAWSPELGIFCIGGRDGQLTATNTSSDGITWVSSITYYSPDESFHDIIWVPEFGLFVSCGWIDGKLHYSDDGRTWVEATAPNSNKWNSIAYSPILNNFAMVDQTGSATGIQVTEPDLSLLPTPILIGTQGVSDIAIIGRDITIGSKYNGTSTNLLGSTVNVGGAETNGSVYVGNDPISTIGPAHITSEWTTHGPLLTDLKFYSLQWMNAPLNKFVAMARAAAEVFAYSSSDGITWVSNGTSFNTTIQSLAWSPELGIMVGTGSTGTALYSYDAISWTQTSIVENTNWAQTIWSSELSTFLSISGDGTRTATSPDGINWSVSSNVHADADYRGLIWSPELNIFCSVSDVVFDTDKHVSTSPDGVTWTDYTGVGGDWSSIAWAPELGLIVAIGVNVCMYSSDGENWTAGTATGNFTWIEWSPQLSLFIAGGSSTDDLAYSIDGMTFIEITDPLDIGWDRVTWSPKLGIFVLASTNSSGASMQKLATNTPKLSSYNQVTTIGTQSVTETKILGKNVEVGTSATDVSIGRYASTVTLGGGGTSIGVGIGASFMGMANMWQQESKTTEGGTFAANTWITRVLNNISVYGNIKCILDTNQITLGPGVYMVSSTAPANRVDRHQLRLYNDTASTTLVTGGNSFGALTENNNASITNKIFNLSVESVLELQHLGETERLTDGLGHDMNIGNAEFSIFAEISIFKLQ